LVQKKLTLIKREEKMRVLVFNSKGGCGKSTVSREVIAGPNASDFVLIEIDELNRTQSKYADSFKAIELLKKDEIPTLLTLLNEHDNVVIDVGADNISATFNAMVDYGLFEDIDRVIIPMKAGRTDCENALKTYKNIKQHCDNIKFVFVEHDDSEPLEDQYSVFFKNMKKQIDIDNLSSNDFATISSSDMFIDAQETRELVVDIAKGEDYKFQALKAKEDNDMATFKILMSKELRKRAAAILVEKTIMPANRVLMG
jgi:MinD-like ATPase involved in chromosome partitioning or flagellar assembly